MKKFYNFTERASELTLSFVASRRFFYGILGLSTLQGLWYALSIRPGMYDEPKHLGYIALYTHHLSPFIAHQTPQYDYLGEVTRNGSYLFYYLMSFPARAVELFTNHQAIVVLVLRFIMIATFILALYVYRKVLLTVGISKFITNVGLLLVILTPMIAPEAGVVNYDNPTFLLTALILLLAVQIVKSDSLDIRKIALLLIISLIGSEIKYEFVAIFVPVFLFIAYDQIRKHKHDFKQKFDSSKATLSKVTKVLLVIGLVVSLGLFIERPVYNFVRYHNLSGAPCTQIISEKRCLKFPLEVRAAKTRQNKPADFKPINPITYASVNWLPTMVGTLIIVLARTPIYFVPSIFYYVLFYGGAIMILLYLRKFMRERSNQLLFFTLIIYVIGLLLYDYKSYATSGAAFAINGRYLLPIMPIFVVFVLVALKKILGGHYHKSALASLLLVLVVLFTQGGSIGTAVLEVPPSLEWHSTSLSRANDGLRYVVHHIIFERNPFSNPFQ